MKPVELAGAALVLALAACPSHARAEEEQPNNEPPAEEEEEPRKSQVKGALLGRLNPQHAHVRDVVFSPDGGSVAAVVRRNKEYFVALLQREQRLDDEVFAEVETPVFSDDGSRMAYVGRRAVDTNPLKSQEAVFGVSQPITRPVDGNGEAPRQSFLIVASALDDPGGQMVWRIFSPSGFAAIYRAQRGSQGPVKEYSAIADSLLLATEQRRMRELDMQLDGPPVFSQDGKRIACRVKHKDGVCVIWGGIDDIGFFRGGDFPVIHSLAFAADKATPVYAVTRKEKMHVVYGQRLSEPYDTIFVPPQVDVERRRVMFGALLADEYWWESMETKF